MSFKTTFYPLGNADTSLLETSQGKHILLDYANKRDPNDPYDKRADLPAELDKVVESEFDVVVFTHADKDHFEGFSEYFYLEHAAKYQSNSRKKILDLWVPAALILETSLDDDEAKVLRAEARHRLRAGKGIKVFSKPDKLKDWLRDEGIEYEKVKHLLVNAGQLVPGWSLTAQGVEFFVHSPFAESIDGSTEIDRNNASIILQAVLNNSKRSKIIFGADAESDVWDDIVSVSKYFKREDRLMWDVFHISHHSSYRSLNSADRGKPKTIPTKSVKWLFETQAQAKGILVSPSNPIPSELGEIQPPHKEAADYYKDVAALKGGEFMVTMEYPSKSKPISMEIKYDDAGATLVKTIASTAFVSSKPAPRAG